MKKVVSFLKKPYSGRLGRIQFLIGFIIGFLAIVVGISVMSGFSVGMSVSKDYWPVFVIFALLCFIALLFLLLVIYITWSVLVRRLHDMGLSGWFIFVIPVVSTLFGYLIGSLVLICLLFIPASEVDRKYGVQIKSLNVFSILLNNKTRDIGFMDKYLYQFCLLLSILFTLNGYVIFGTF